MIFNPLYCIWGCCTIPQRLILAIMIHLGIQNCYNLRSVFVVVINEMVKREAKNRTSLACPNLPPPEVEIKGGSYPWNSNMEALIKYAFYIGYFIGHFPGGWMADKFGGRWVMEISMLLSAAVSVTMPFFLSISNGSIVVAVALRSLLGLFQGPIIPTVSTLVSIWTPRHEKATLGGIAYSGAYLGQVIGSVVTGVLVQNAGNWHVAFYFWSFITILWCSLGFVTMFSYPSTHPFITAEEKAYLDEHIQKKKKFKIPWKAVLTSAPVWAIVAGHFAHSYVVFVMLADLPKYMRDILNMDIQKYGMYSGLPFLGAWISSTCFGWVSDFITSHTKIRNITMRKTYTILANIVAVLCNVLAVYVGCTRVGAVVLYVVSLFLLGLSQPGLKINVNDLTFNYGGIIMAMVNGGGAISGIMGLAVTGWVSSERTLGEWRLIMWIMLVFSSLLTIVYLTFATCERQEWDMVEENQ